MPAPLSRQFLPIKTPESMLERRIDDHYHLEMIAHDSRQIVAYQAQSLRMQHDAAVAILHTASNYDFVWEGEAPAEPKLCPCEV